MSAAGDMHDRRIVLLSTPGSSDNTFVRALERFMDQESPAKGVRTATAEQVAAEYPSAAPRPSEGHTGALMHPVDEATAHRSGELYRRAVQMTEAQLLEYRDLEPGVERKATITFAYDSEGTPCE